MNRAILIKSCQKNLDRDTALWETWAKTLRRYVPVILVTGGAKAQELRGAPELRPPEDGDEIVDPPEETPTRLLLNTLDDLGNNSIKLKLAIPIILSRWRLITHLFIVDDDTFIHPARWFAHTPRGEFECRLYHPKTENELRLNAGEAWANGGAGWYMSSRLCKRYCQEVTRRCSWDDVLATRVAMNAGVEIIDRPDLYGDSRNDTAPMVAVGNKLITCHPCTPEETLRRWKAIVT